MIHSPSLSPQHAEYAHALQFIMDFDDDGRGVAVYDLREHTPKSTSRDELEADAMAGYALSHEQGRNFELVLRN